MTTKRSKDIMPKGKTSTVTKNVWLQHLKKLGKLIPPLTLILRLGSSLPAIPSNIPPQLPPGCSEVTEYVRVIGFEAGRVTKSCPSPATEQVHETEV